MDQQVCLLIFFKGHPYEPTLAVSGLDNTIKIFSSDRNAQLEARQGVNILNPDHPSNMFGARPRNTAGGSQAFGLRSCKRIRNSYQITSQNDIERQGGLSDAFITVRAGPVFIANPVKLIMSFSGACWHDSPSRLSSVMI